MGFAVTLSLATGLALLVLWLRTSVELKKLKARLAPVISIDTEIDRLKTEAENVRRETDAIRTTYSEKRQILEELEQQVAIFDERIAFAEFGLYEPHFDFGDSETYKNQIKTVRETQKAMVSQGRAVHSPTNWTVDGSRAKGRTMANRQTRLTLRAFNSECTAAISSTRWNNVVAMEKRILNAAKQIDQANTSVGISITG